MASCTRLFSIVCAGLLLAAASVAEVPADAVWIDVRSPSEYAEGHLEQASNIPWDGISTGILALEVDKDAPIYLYCGSGKRAGKAMEQLQLDGYSNVVNVGGIEDARQLVAGDEAL